MSVTQRTGPDLRRTTGRKVSKKLRKRYATGTITKSKITQRGYNKFLKVTGNEHITVSIDENLVAEDKRWDGLKGYITNADLKILKKVSKSGQVKN